MGNGIMDAQATTSDRRTRLRHHGAAGELFKIYVVNILLTLVTLGIYRFWAKTRVRRYLWGQTSFLDDRIEYTGTGKELFLGFLLVSAFLVVAIVIVRIVLVLAGADSALAAVLKLLLFAGIVGLVGIAKFRARRYRLSRTLWRGIRGAQTGSSLAYGARYLGYALLTGLTLGFYWPYMSTKLTAYKLTNTRFGNRPFHFDGVGRDLLKRFAVAWLLFLPTIGLSAIWYRAAALRYVVSRTRYENLTFATGVRGGPLAKLIVTNWLLTVFTLGLAYPLVLVRTARFACDNLEVAGEQDFALIAQSAKEVPTTGEGLAEAFDVGEF